MFDAGHSHGPTPYLVPGCPLCEPTRTARNRAIAHLAEALQMLSDLDHHTGAPTIRLHLGPIGITEDDVDNFHGIDLTAKQAEALADAVDSMHAHASSDPGASIPIDPGSMARSTARFMGWLQGQSGEAIESGEWSAAAVAQCNPDLYADVTDLFLLLDPREITATVLDHRQVDMVRAVEALDDWFGEIADPYADEDDA